MCSSKTGTKILVVDDERNIADTLVRILNQSGFLLDLIRARASRSEQERDWQKANDYLKALGYIPR